MIKTHKSQFNLWSKFLLPLRANLRLLRSPIKFLTHKWRTRPKEVRYRYNQYTCLGQPLETIKSSRLLTQHLPDRCDPVSLLWKNFYSRRLAGPKLLDDLETRELSAALSTVKQTDSEGRGNKRWSELNSRLVNHAQKTLDNINLFNQEAQLKESSHRRKTVLIDIRGLQDYSLVPYCGSRTHAELIVQSASERINIDSTISLIFLTNPQLPVENSLLEGYEYGVCSLDSLPSSDQLIAILDPLGIGSPIDEKLPAQYYRDPKINRITVWLDAITSTYPNWFLGNADTFFEWQSRYETILGYQLILNLSNSSLSEIAPLITESTQIITTGSDTTIFKSSIKNPDRHPEIPFPKYVLAVGNALPHKNIASSPAAFSRNTNQAVGLVVWGRLTRQQELGVEAISAHLRISASRLCYLSDVPLEKIGPLIANAQLVFVPSFHEGFSLPIIEAITNGTPVVASDIPAHQELIGPGWWLQPPSDPAKLGRAINRALKDPQALLNRQTKRLAQSWHSGQVSERINEMFDQIFSADN